MSTIELNDWIWKCICNVRIELFPYLQNNATRFVPGFFWVQFSGGI
jgi:hypothetical protein